MTNQKNNKKNGLSRRDFLRLGAEAATFAGIVGAVGVLPAEGRYIRPPRALPEGDFSKKCMRCGACVQVCPEKALDLKDLTLDVKNMSTPVINTKFGGCRAWTDGCRRCAEVCPTGALDLQRPLQQERLATISIEPEECVNCMVCFRRCAIEGAVLFPNPDGEPFTREKDIPLDLKLVNSPLKPYFDNSKCVGCGMCVAHCPPRVLKLHPVRRK